MAREDSLQELLNTSFEYQMAGVNTAITATVVSVEGLSKGMISAQPSVNMKFKDGQIKEWPTIESIPIVFPSSSTSALTFPINAGDPVLLIFSMRGLDNFKNGNGLPATPTDFRKFDLSDAIAIPSPFPKGKSINNPDGRVWDHSIGDMVMSHNLGSGNEVEFRLKADGGIQIRSTKDVEILGKNIAINATESFSLTSPKADFDIPQTTWIGSLSQTGDYTQMGNYTATGVQTFNGIVFSTHKHISAVPGSPTGVPIP